MLSSCRYIFGKRPGAILRRRLCLTNRPRTPLLAPRFWRVVASFDFLRPLLAAELQRWRPRSCRYWSYWVVLCSSAGRSWVHYGPAPRPAAVRARRQAEQGAARAGGGPRVDDVHGQPAPGAAQPAARDAAAPPARRAAAGRHERAHARLRDFRHASACSGDSCATRVPSASKRCTLPASSPQ